MRQDAKNLLERLSKKEFRYQEFDDTFADLDLWPLFEALLTDARVVGQRASSLREAEVEIRNRAVTEARHAPGSREFAPVHSEPSLFGRYNGGPGGGPGGGPRGKVVNLRQFLGQLSDKDA